MIEFQQVAGILCLMKRMKNIRNGAINHSKLRFLRKGAKRNDNGKYTETVNRLQKAWKET